MTFYQYKINIVKTNSLRIYNHCILFRY